MFRGSFTAMVTPFKNGGLDERAFRELDTAMRQALLATVDKVDGMGGADFSPDYGHGRLNLQALVQHARQHAVA